MLGRLSGEIKKKRKKENKQLNEQLWSAAWAGLILLAAQRQIKRLLDSLPGAAVWSYLKIFVLGKVYATPCWLKFTNEGSQMKGESLAAGWWW